jgi:hypothetical protein
VTAQVVDLDWRRELRDMNAALDKLQADIRRDRIANDPELRRRVARAVLAEMLVRYGALLDHLRSPLFEMIELALLAGDDGDYGSALALVLRDNLHFRTPMSERLAARERELVEHYSRLLTLGALAP